MTMHLLLPAAIAAAQNVANAPENRMDAGSKLLLDKPLPQFEWGHDLQKRLMAAAKDCDEDELANLLGEAASLLAMLIGRPA